MSDIQTSKTLVFALDVLVVQGFIALSWLSPYSGFADFFIATGVLCAISLIQEK